MTDPPHVLMKFRVSGGGWWLVTAAQLAEMRECYPELDVMSILLKLQAKCERLPQRTGLMRSLVISWLRTARKSGYPLAADMVGRVSR